MTSDSEVGQPLVDRRYVPSVPTLRNARLRTAECGQHQAPSRERDQNKNNKKLTKVTDKVELTNGHGHDRVAARRRRDDGLTVVSDNGSRPAQSFSSIVANSAVAVGPREKRSNIHAVHHVTSRRHGVGFGLQGAGGQPQTVITS